MTLTQELLTALRNGVHRIGEVEIQASDSNARFHLCHHSDSELSRQPDFGGLAVSVGPQDARRISLYAADGTYRFLKAQRNLARGWVMVLESAEDLRLALDQLYPAAVGLWLASRRGTLEVETLRQKLDRQSGMYRRAKQLPDDRAQALVSATCAADPVCARRILWPISPALPLAPGPAADSTGIADGLDASEAIPLLCAAPCNHFVAECLAASKQPTPPTP